MPLVLFPADSLERYKPERDFAHEVAAAQAAGFGTAIFDFDGLLRGDAVDDALRRVSAADASTPAIYRGWMLQPAHYQQLHAGLLDRNYQLLNSPQAFQRCHYLPEAYEFIREHTPATVWFGKDEILRGTELDFVPIHQKLTVFGDKPILIKDYVKSQKHRWAEACFIRSAADVSAVERVTIRFVELQGPHLSGGLVYREFLDLQPIGVHSQSGMPLTAEWRAFVLDGKPLLLANYWADVDYALESPSLNAFMPALLRLDSRFFVVDIAQDRDGNWHIIETGDGQVSGLPTPELASEFYARLAGHLLEGNV